MSRTYKDKPYKFSLQKKEWELYESIPCVRWYTDYYTKELKSYNASWCHDLPRAKVLKKRSYTERNFYRGCKAPSWFVKEFMNRPERRKMRMWERSVLFEDIEETDPPVMYQNFEYYW
ncbi:hypothetical protein UFOVP273_79 [uncultured Caudovirales phage]|uniref:Uncharacterized protein n=1 Tax=uncultured Caudovirales phage TaxID=2100421 RepID=A0A6J5LNA0_9CAUD|nr:hypothetical protein UFOVP273_79 [uncultured Caudovirales phage]